MYLMFGDEADHDAVQGKKYFVYGAIFAPTSSLFSRTIDAICAIDAASIWKLRAEPPRSKQGLEFKQTQTV